MSERCRVVVCGFDPILVRGYVKTGERALWWHLPDELYEDYKVQPGDAISGKLLAVYNGEGEKIASPNEDFTWRASNESGLAIVLPPEVITKYKLTEFHFLELSIEKIGRDGQEEEVYPGETKLRKWWPDERMKLEYKVDYIE
ncbi:MAG: hypothetical protein D6791_10530 [Chloroflexi bacterium]|nr:MAG: hypothetical protein D6791_10530 [Chloroflexota bacterium]